MQSGVPRARKRLEERLLPSGHFTLPSRGEFSRAEAHEMARALARTSSVTSLSLPKPGGVILQDHKVVVGLVEDVVLVGQQNPLVRTDFDDRKFGPPRHSSGSANTPRQRPGNLRQRLVKIDLKFSSNTAPLSLLQHRWPRAAQVGLAEEKGFGSGSGAESGSSQGSQGSQAAGALATGLPAEQRGGLEGEVGQGDQTHPHADHQPH